jgi:hypothetical protein
MIARRKDLAMRTLSMMCLLLAACAHAAPEPAPVRERLMARCAAACDPAEAVQAIITADQTRDLWICVCRPTTPGTATSANDT